MAKIVITGGGIIGLSTAMLLAKSGHEVTVLERDPAIPPSEPTEAWGEWERQGVNQFRMLHYFLPRFRTIVEEELPAMVPAFEAAGGLRSTPRPEAPDAVPGGSRPGDEVHEAIPGRRPVFEAVVARLAESTPGVEVRRGVSVAGFLTGTPALAGIPNVVGVRTETGEEVLADLVVDATGRRSPLPRWLDGIGARPPIEESEDSGFIYYGRHFRSSDGSVPFAFGPLLQPYGSLSTLTLPADNGTWGVGLITSASDAALRPLKQADTWMRVLRSFPLVAHWADGEPLDEAPAVMAKIEDRIRRFVVGGVPVATGGLAIADSWACTNPSLGRGMSIGIMHALALRDLLRNGPLDDPVKLALSWDDVTDAVVVPWYKATLHFDRHRLAEIDAVVRGEPYEPGDPVWDVIKCLECAAGRDPEMLRAYISIVGLVRSGEELFAEPGLLDRAMSVGGDWRTVEAPGPNREQLLATVSG